MKKKLLRMRRMRRMRRGVMKTSGRRRRGSGRETELKQKVKELVDLNDKKNAEKKKKKKKIPKSGTDDWRTNPSQQVIEKSVLELGMETEMKERKKKKKSA
jgi:hypothetical protein